MIKPSDRNLRLNRSEINSNKNNKLGSYSYQIILLFIKTSKMIPRDIERRYIEIDRGRSGKRPLDKIKNYSNCCVILSSFFVLMTVSFFFTKCYIE